jgi:bacterioferritin-associated ferredoxin
MIISILEYIYIQILKVSLLIYLMVPSQLHRLCNIKQRIVVNEECGRCRKKHAYFPRGNDENYKVPQSW